MGLAVLRRRSGQVRCDQGEIYCLPRVQQRQRRTNIDGRFNHLNGYLPNAIAFQAKKFEQFKESNCSWSLGLSSADGGTCFYRVEIDILRNLNMIAIEAFRDISRLNEPGKTLRRVRKVYRVPDEFDIATLQTSSSSGGTITLEVFPREAKSSKGSNSHVAHRRLLNGHHLKRSGSAVVGI